MSKLSFAQRLLSLFTAPDRAASIIGDLTEESRSRGPSWYWCNVVGTAFALCLKSVRLAPWRSFRVGASGFSIYVLIYMVLAAVTGLFGFLRYFDPANLDFSLTTAPLGFWIRVVVAVSISNLLTGMILGRWVPRGEPSGSAPLIVLWLISWVLWPFLAEFVYKLSWYFNLGLALAFPVFYLIPLLVGGALAQRRTAT